MEPPNERQRLGRLYPGVCGFDNAGDYGQTVGWVPGDLSEALGRPLADLECEHGNINPCPLCDYPGP